jgi:hypothetical protein
LVFAPATNEDVDNMTINVRRTFAILFLVFIALMIAVIAFVQTPSFQAELHRRMNEDVPKGWFHAWACLWSLCNPFKVIDPADPAFDPARFSFRDYPGTHYMRYALGLLIRRGMSRQEIEDILVRSGNAKVVETTTEVEERILGRKLEKGEHNVRYTHPETGFPFGLGTWVVRVRFDDDRRAVSVALNGKKIDEGEYRGGEQ